MNTRIQVEHPVTECITRIDLLREMIRIAGANHWLSASRTSRPGSAIEVASTPRTPGGLPAVPASSARCASRRTRRSFRQHALRRLHRPPFYDSLLGKLVVMRKRGTRAIARLQRALLELEIGGMKTTVPLHTRPRQTPISAPPASTQSSSSCWHRDRRRAT